MALYLVQHGLSAAKDVDPQRGLTAKGVKETERIAEVAGNYHIDVKEIVHSGKTRARQTAAIYHRALSVKTPMEAWPGINPLDDVRTFAQKLDPGRGLMIVGHLPFLSRLVSLLTAGSEDILVYQFQNSGIACLDALVGTDHSPDWFIRWTLNPHIS